MKQIQRSELSSALERGEFRLHYQPKVDLESGRVIGLEALVRWQHPQRGVLFPDQFIALAEDSGLIVQLGEWVLRTACTQSKAWQAQGLEPGQIAVNLSPIQLDREFVRKVQDILAETGLEPKHLQLEVTARVWPPNMKLALEVLARLGEIGVQLAMDNFGSGCASFAYLRQLPTQVLNVDRQWVRDVASGPGNTAFVDSLVTIARSLNKTLMAEGVETVEQLTVLRAGGCHQMQGYLFSQPLPADEVAPLLQEGRPLGLRATQ